MALTTVANYKTWAGIGVTEYDSALAVILPQVELLVAQALNRADGGTSRLEATGSDITEYYDGNGLKELYLRAYPIISVTSVSYLSSVSAGAASYVAFDSGTYYQDATSGRMVRSGYVDFGFAFDDSIWPEGSANIKVVYQGGYTWNTLPDDIDTCIYEVTSIMLHNRSGNRTEASVSELRDLILARIGHHRRKGL